MAVPKTITPLSGSSPEKPLSGTQHPSVQRQTCMRLSLSSLSDGTPIETQMSDMQDNDPSRPGGGEIHLRAVV